MQGTQGSIVGLTITTMNSRKQYHSMSYFLIYLAKKIKQTLGSKIGMIARNKNHVLE